MKYIISVLALMLVSAPLATLAADASSQPNIATFSVVAYYPATGEVGVAVQSKFFAVGSVVPYAKAGVGAVATQAFGHPAYGAEGLILMQLNLPPAEAFNEISEADTDAARRQVGMVSVLDGGLAFSFTGEECMDWAGGLTGVTPEGIIYSVQGNILTGPEVVGAMAFAMENYEMPEATELSEEQARVVTIDDFAGRLLIALLAGQAAGGDSRGMQSAALLVHQDGAGYGGFNDRKYDLRVDDAEDPFEELARLLNLARPFTMATEGYTTLYAGEYEKAIGIFKYLVDLDPENNFNHYNLACAYSLAGDLDAAMVELSTALELDETMLQHASGDPDLEPLHEREDFKELFAGMEPVDVENVNAEDTGE